MRLLPAIAVKHLMARKRQSFVSLLGIILGVAFFLAISSLMQGSQKDFMSRLVDNSPHITISDDYRDPHRQPLQDVYKHIPIQMQRVKPETETRGIRHYEQVIDYLRTIPGVIASPVLQGEALINFAGKDFGVSLQGMIPEEVRDVTTIQQYMLEGSVDDLVANRDGILIGAELARRLSIQRGEMITVAATTGQVHTFKVLGIFQTGRSSYDLSQTFTNLTRVQALMDRIHRVNSIIIKLDDPNRARTVAAEIERHIGYKAVSWQEQSEDLMNTIAIRNIIMYTVVSAVLVVAAFGIYNVISTVVMEKQRDIAIMKSMGFHASDIKWIFVIQGAVLGFAGNAIGLPLGMAIMGGLMQVKMKIPGSHTPVPMPIDWGWQQFAIASAFAFIAAVVAALLPARKAAHVDPVDILRGGM